MTTSIWIATFLGVLAYFLLKARKNQLDAQAANIPFDFWKALSGDWFDGAVSLGLSYLFLSSGGDGIELPIEIPGLNINFSSTFGAFMTGIVISYVGVNYIMGLIGQIPAFKVGDNTRKELRETIGNKAQS